MKTKQQYDWIEVEVPNWDRYNPRTDRRNHSWFRVQNTIMSDPKLYGLTAAQRFVIICVFAEVSKNGGGSVRINIDWFADQLNLKKSEIIETLEDAATTGVLWLPEDPERGRPVDLLLTTDGRTDEHAHQEMSEGPIFEAEKEIEEIYREYPNKKGKKRGVQLATKIVKTPETAEGLRNAVRRYKAEILREQTPKRFIKHFSSFMSCYEDYLEPHPNSADPSPPTLRGLDDLKRELEELNHATA